jgi:hypothetical protein
MATAFDALAGSASATRPRQRRINCGRTALL